MCANCRAYTHSQIFAHKHISETLIGKECAFNLGNRNSLIDQWNNEFQIWIDTAGFLSCRLIGWKAEFIHEQNLLREEIHSSQRFLLKTELFAAVSVFCMTVLSLGLLEVCMMTHRAPLSPPSTTHEPWPLIPHMWVWDAVALATTVSTESFW